MPAAFTGNPMRRARLTTYTIVVVGILVIGALWGMAFSAIHAETRAAMDHAHAEACNLAAAFADEVAHVMRNVEDAMTIVAQHMQRQAAGPFDV